VQLTGLRGAPLPMQLGFRVAAVEAFICDGAGWWPQLKRGSLGGFKRRRLRAVLLAVALDVGTKRWQTLILT
jgi:hypothetical protein